jgi:hypothetical protein
MQQNHPPSSSQQAGKRDPYKVLKLVLLSMAIVGFTGFWVVFDAARPYLFPAKWKVLLRQATAIQEREPEKSQVKLTEALAEAERDKSTRGQADVLLALGQLSHQQRQTEQARKYFDRSLGLYEKLGDPKLLASASQSAAWSEHLRFWSHAPFTPKVEYQERAWTAAKKAWAPQDATVYLWTLASLNLDADNVKEARKCVNEASQLTKASDFSEYELNIRARLAAYEHDWKKSLAEFFAMRAKDKRHSDSDYYTALGQVNPAAAKYTQPANLEKLLQDKQFAKLDEIASSLRQKPEVLPSGYWTLDDFYSDLSDVERSDSDRKWQEYFSLLDAWIKASPQSPTPKIAKAGALVDYAWKARGGGYANTVSDDGWRLMKERLQQADELLKAANALPVKCPHMYYEWQTVALGQGWELKQYDHLIADAQKNYPTYAPALMHKTYFVQPRWHGKEGDAETFMKQAADKVGGTDGDILYARLVWYLQSLNLSDKFFAENKVDWKRTERGMQAIIKRYPHDTMPRAELIRLALDANHEDVAKHVFDTPV